MGRGKKQLDCSPPKMLKEDGGPVEPGDAVGVEVTRPKSNMDNLETPMDSESAEQDPSREVRKSTRLKHRLASHRQTKSPHKPSVKVARGEWKRTGQKPDEGWETMTPGGGSTVTSFSLPKVGEDEGEEVCLEAEVKKLKRENKIFRDKIVNAAKTFSRKQREVKVQKGLVATLSRVLELIVDSEMPFGNAKEIIGGALGQISGGMVGDPVQAFSDCFNSWDQEERLVSLIYEGLLKGLGVLELPAEPFEDENVEIDDNVEPLANVVEQPEPPSQKETISKATKMMKEESDDDPISLDERKKKAAAFSDTKEEESSFGKVTVQPKKKPARRRIAIANDVGEKLYIGSDGYSSDSTIREGAVMLLKQKKVKIHTRQSGYTSEPVNIGSRKRKIKTRLGRAETSTKIVPVNPLPC